ncbi:hypothetical protein [Haloglomus halophilum]|uniref:hypothetical protein n=1 Tax=Haloglomus halophilum TaxID=2962672 RepID=UPI0020C93AC3|nr:hypothetical protein [Haloglomus halophilum]
MNQDPRAGLSDERAVAGLSRRQLLAAMTAVGATGGFVGVSTGASLFDRERLDGRFVAGIVDLGIAHSVNGGNEQFTDGSTVSLDLGELEPGSENGGHADLRLVLPDTGNDAAPNNPAYPWFRPSCIDTSGGLVDDLQVTLRYVDCATGDVGAVVFSWGSLREFVETFREGFALDGRSRPNRTPGNQACLDDTVCLRLDYHLASDFEGEGTAQVDIDFVATQCRNHTGEENPFAGSPGRLCDEPPEEEPDYKGISYIEVWTEVEGVCKPLGKLELDSRLVDQCAPLVAPGDGDPANDPDIGDSFVRPGRYSLPDDLPASGPCTDTGYDIRITATATKDGGTETTAVAFELLNDDGTAGPDLCTVVIKGGSGTTVYDGDDLDGNATAGLLYAPEGGR